MATTDSARGLRAALPEALCALLFSFTLAVFAPLEMYVSNADTLWFPLATLLPYTALAFALLLGLSLGATLLARERARAVLCALFFALGLLFYLQGNFLNPDLGRLTGETIDWSRYEGYAIGNTAIWALLAVGCVVAALCRAGVFRKVALFVCSVLVAMQIITLGTLLATAPPTKESGAYCFTNDGLLSFSTEENILLIALDTFDTTSFADCLEAQPELADTLDGFTWFPNSVCVYPVTKYAIPYLLTGSAYTFSGDYEKERAAAWRESAFVEQLGQRDYVTKLYTESYYIEADMADTVQNIARERLVVSDPFGLWLTMLRYTGFRYAPQLLKPSLWVAGNEFEPFKTNEEGSVYQLENAAFQEALRDTEATLDGSRASYRLYHLEGLHTPYRFTEACETAPLGTVTQHQQIRGLFAMLDTLFAKMKALGVFDSATIVITADHGNLGLDPSPLLLIKRPNDSEPLRQNAALASQADYHQTMAAAAGWDARLGYGEDLFALAQDDPRETFYLNFRWADGDVFYDYLVERDALGRAAYAATGTQFTPYGMEERAIRTLEADEVVAASSVQALAPYLDEICQYYLEQGREGVWLNAPWERFVFQLPQDVWPSAVRVTFAISEICGERQDVQVMVDNELWETVTLNASDETLSFMIPEDAFDIDTVRFTLRFPQAVSESDFVGLFVVLG